MNSESFQGLGGRVVTPCDPSYSAARQDWNRAIQQFPVIINYCSTAQEVSRAVLWARENSIPLRMRNGGHNYEGYSNGDCVLVIDVSEMSGITLNDQQQTVTVQGGVTNGQLYNFVASRGYPFPGGTCPTVGVCGYSLGGGWGLSCRIFGLGCDSIVEVQLVDAQGEIITANAQTNQDLFWALRGAGGGNFGVVVSVTFRLPPPVQFVTLIEIDYLGVNANTQALLLETWQNWIDGADARLTLIARIYNSKADGLSMLVRGIFYGEAADATRLVQNFLAIPGAVFNIQYMTFLEAVTIIGEAYPSFEVFQSVSRFVYRSYSPEEICRLVSLIQQPSQGSVFAGFSMYALGGQVARVGEDDTAFYYRNAKYIVWLQTIWEEKRYAFVNREWIRARLPILEPLTVGSYVNFPYSDLCCYLTEYYGPHVAELKMIKKKYDPCNVFSFPQGLAQWDDGYAKTVFSAEPFAPFGKSDTVQITMPNTNYRGFRYVQSEL